MKKIKIRYYFLLFGLLLFPLLFWRSSDDNIDPLGAAVLPQDATLLLHTGTWTLSGAVNPFPREKMYFYNAEGEVLTSTLDMEEFLGRGIFANERLCYFVNNHTVLMDPYSTRSYTEYEEDTFVSVGATPSESGSGYIREMDIYYALQNVGRRAGNDRYISVLRLVSLEHSYDVIIPYCVSDLCYDSLKQQFVCVLSDLTRPSEGYPGYEHYLNTGEYEGLAYLVIPYDSASQQFSLREEVTVLPNPALQIDSYAQGVLVKDNFLYQVSLRHNTFRTGGNQDLVLSTYALENNRYVSSVDLLSQYDSESPEYSWAVGGCIGANRPVIRNGFLYVFVSPTCIFKISDGMHIETLEMWYPFQDVVNITTAPLTNLEDAVSPPGDFSGTLLHITEENEIYVLLLFKDGNLRLYKLLDDGNYRFCWQGPLPPGLNYDIHICDFVLLHDFE